MPTIMITGATGHVGQGLAMYFAKHGHDLVLAARDSAKLTATVSELSIDARTSVFDLGDHESISKAVESLHADGVHIDWLINNAADVTSKPLMRTPLEEIDNQVRANITGTMQLTKLLLEGMIPRNNGAIVNISSLAGYKANPGQTPYSVTKSALNAFSEALRMEVGNSGVHIVNVALASVAEGRPGSGQVTTERVASRIEDAIALGKNEVYFSPLTRILMKIYAAFPSLRLHRKPHTD